MTPENDKVPKSGDVPIPEPLKFILAGNAYFTLRSTKTGTRYTYRVSRAFDEITDPVSLKPVKKFKDIWFVSLLTGPDNWQNYTYIGILRGNALEGQQFATTGKSKLPLEAAPVKAITYAIDCLRTRPDAPGVEIFHAGKCGRCGRMLTVPESIISGFGPECLDALRLG